jgi:hypothetical protein
MAVNHRTAPASGGGRGGKSHAGGRRGQDSDLSHLLGFQLPPRQAPPPPRRQESSKKREHPNLQRQRYIHAQYRESPSPCLS